MKFVDANLYNGLNEITQSLDVKFAFIKRVGVDTYTNIMPWAKCRDYFGDALWAEQSGKTQGIYGFSFDPKKQKLYKNKLMFAMKFPTDESRYNFLKNYTDVQLLLRQHSLPEFYVLWSDSVATIIEAPKFWRSSVVAISLFTFLMKCACYKLDPNKDFFDAVLATTAKKEQWDGTIRESATLESTYVRDIKGTLPTLLQNLKELTGNLQTVHGYPADTCINQIHNNSGFYSVCKKHCGEVGQRLKALL